LSLFATAFLFLSLFTFHSSRRSDLFFTSPLRHRPKDTITTTTIIITTERSLDCPAVCRDLLNYHRLTIFNCFNHFPLLSATLSVNSLAASFPGLSARENQKKKKKKKQR
jgi:hypothetical protein